MSFPKDNKLFLTNDYSILSKYSAAKKGYYEDEILIDFIENFLKIKATRSPLVDHGYAARTKLIRSLIIDSDKGIDCYRQKHCSPDFYIVLGAGYDTLALQDLSSEKFAKDKEKIWVEIDLAEVVEKKLQYIQQSEILLKNHGEIKKRCDCGTIYSTKSNQYHLIALDLRDTEKLASYLKSIFEFQFEPSRINIINEVCLCYLDKCYIEKILRAIIDTATNLGINDLCVHYYGFEQVIPVNNQTLLSKLMLEHFESLGHPLKYFPTYEECSTFLYQIGFRKINIVPAKIALRRLYDRVQNIEPFDEMEELDSYLSHYAVVSASKKLLISQANCHREISKHVRHIDSNLIRYGHASCVLNCTDRILVTGGFGIKTPSDVLDHKQQPHSRLSDVKILERNDENDTYECSDVIIDSSISGITMDRLHGQVVDLKDNKLIFFNGGRQNPSKRNSSNCSFIASLNGDTLKLVCDFKNTKFDRTYKWRHRCIMRNDTVYQIGGLGLDTGKYECRDNFSWNLSSDKLGLNFDFSNDLYEFRRHSFGLDLRDSNTLFIFGGKSSDNCGITKSDLLVSWDFRNHGPMAFKKHKNLTRNKDRLNCYGSDIHFINDYQMVKIGGINCEYGYQDSYVDLIDIRNESVITLLDESSSPDADKYFTMLSGATSCHFKNRKQMVTLGGGGNYFTFGTKFNKSHLIYDYSN